MLRDAIIVGEEWISEYYFTNDGKKKEQSFLTRVLQCRKEWDELAADGHSTPRTRLARIRGDLAGALSTLDEQSSADGQVDPDYVRERIYRPLREALGYTGGGFTLTTRGPLTEVAQPDLAEGAPLVLIDARPADTIEQLLNKDKPTLLEPYLADSDENHPVTSVARLLSRCFVSDDGPKYAVVFAGRWMLLAERERWPEGRYLAVNIQLVAGRNDLTRGGETDYALACLAADSTAPNAEGTIWWDVTLEESIKHTVAVSQNLREGVRRSIEIIANDVVRRRSARGLTPLPTAQAQPLAKQALRYLYRILFLLYAEASPELEVLPINVDEYEQGYSLGRMRDLVQVELTHDAANRTHFYASLKVLFDLVDSGNHPPLGGVNGDAVDGGTGDAADDDSTDPGESQGLTFNSLKADLFLPSATLLIDEVQLSDGSLQRVLAYLLLTKEKHGNERGYISYAELGINQLGAVYEGLMSYTGFFAQTDLYEVAKDGDPAKGSWVVPVERSHDPLFKQHFVTVEDPITGEVSPVMHAAGSFVYRLAGRERQQSASYYTPEVLTRFVVSQALEELLDQNDKKTTAAEILDLTICEPALGSGAFAIEAVRQLAEQYLKRRQKELGKDIDPDAYPKELQRVKASIALHQTYGVDLNATAVELAEISLWLDTMVAGLAAPWFGLHLKRGNSLIGARRAVYSREQVNNKSWLKDVPRNVPVADLVENMAEGRLAQGTAGAIHHFLLPADGWGSAVDAKEAKELAPEALAALKLWRRSILTKPSKKQLDQLVNLSYRVETLWQFALRRLEIAEREARRDIPLWGHPDAPRWSSSEERAYRDPATTPVTRAEIERKLNDPYGAFQRLRRVMDAWNALWFWPLTTTLTGDTTPPALDQWIAGITSILGTHFEGKKASIAQGQTTLGLPANWHDLGVAEELDLSLAGARPVAEFVETSSWLVTTEMISSQQGFFHWQLDFATVFTRGGFDLQLGNPPWVRPRSDVAALLAEGDPWWQLVVKQKQAVIAAKRIETLALDGIPDLVIEGTTDTAATAAFIGARQNYPTLEGLQPDLYRCFMERTWSNASSAGISGLIHFDTHFTEEKAGRLRSATYVRLRRHWHFVNELLLFEIEDHKRYSVNIYGPALSRPSFLHAAWLYHPDTVTRSLAHDGSGEEPGLKDPLGSWDLRPHRSRITRVEDRVLQAWHDLTEDVTVPLRQTRMVYAVNWSSASVLNKLSRTRRVGDLELQTSGGWLEGSDNRKGFFEVDWGSASSWRDVILQGPNFFVGRPFYKSPNETLKNNQDWAEIDIETLAANALPITAFKPSTDREQYDSSYTHWGPNRVPARSQYRVAWRRMAANQGERTLISAIIPPGAAHVDGVNSAGFCTADESTLAQVAATLSSLISDFTIRTVPKGDIRQHAIDRLAFPSGALSPELVHRALRLNAVTNAYANLWEGAYSDSFKFDAWAGGLDYPGRMPLASASAIWTPTIPLRRASDRRQALVEIDAIVAITLGLSADELCTVYRTQFAVLYSYDTALPKAADKYYYDTNGRLVPNCVHKLWRQKGDRVTAEDRTAKHPAGTVYTYELPFITLDREVDMRQAYTHFERILNERS